MKMPSTNTSTPVTGPTDASANPSNKTMEYEILVLPHGDNDNESMTNQPIRTKTKHISCNNQNGQIFWIPEGYRPVLVRTTDLPLLVGTEYSSPSSSDDGNDSN